MNDNKEQAIDGGSSTSSSSDGDGIDLRLAQLVMTTTEYQVLQELRDPIRGPFANVWKQDLHHWGGIRDAQAFWQAVPSVTAHCWQYDPTTPATTMQEPKSS